MSKVESTAALDALLDEEREALLKGDLERLTELLAPKERLVEAIAELAQEDPEGVRALSDKVQRNQLLFDGALEGIRAVAGRMARLREVKGALETYGADGKRLDLPLDTENSVEHRA